MKLKYYLYSQLSSTFFPIFLGLFFITSVIFLVRLSSLTAVITLDFIEFFRLFSYTIPDIIFYTLSISFYISMVISLSKLSAEYEMTVITSFGISPLKILRIYLPLCCFISLFLLIVSVALIPKSDFERRQFTSIKKNEAIFNIKSAEFGQKFGDWLIFIGSKDDNLYKDVKLLKIENSKDQFIVSKSAILNTNKSVLSIKLDSGKAFVIDDKEISQIDYKIMYLNDLISEKKTNIFTNSYDYWINNIKNKEDLDILSLHILTSCLSLFSLFLVATFGYFNPRYEKNRAVAYSIISIVVYYVLVKSLGSKLLLHSLYIVPIVWISLSYYLYSKTIKKEY